MTRHWLKGLIGMCMLGALATVSAAAELKTIIILNAPQDPLRMAMTERAVKALSDAGFRDRDTISLTILNGANLEEEAQQVIRLAPQVVINLRGNQQSRMFEGQPFPVIGYAEAERYVGADGTPAGNITGVYSILEDLVYNSYKFLRLVAPLQPSQSAVFFENRNAPRLSKEAAAEALQRLNIPLKAVRDGTVFEDWQEALLTYNDDPEVGWILMGVAPTIKRDGSVTNIERDCAVWLREHVKKPMVTYWEVAVQWGLLCGLAADLHEVGTQCGEMAVRVLNGEDITTIKAEYPRKTVVALNRKTADVMGIIFSPDVLNLANVIYHDWENKEVTRKSGLK